MRKKCLPITSPASSCINKAIKKDLLHSRLFLAIIWMLFHFHVRFTFVVISSHVNRLLRIAWKSTELFWVLTRCHVSHFLMALHIAHMRLDNYFLTQQHCKLSHGKCTKSVYTGSRCLLTWHLCDPIRAHQMIIFSLRESETLEQLWLVLTRDQTGFSIT